MECPLTMHLLMVVHLNHCLNPCSNGMPSDIEHLQTENRKACLNPCSNGMPSDTMIQRALTFLLF